MRGKEETGKQEMKEGEVRLSHEITSRGIKVDVNDERSQTMSEKGLFELKGGGQDPSQTQKERKGLLKTLLHFYA